MATGSLDLKWIPNPVTASAGGNSAAIIFPGNVSGVTVTAIPGGGGSATVHHTTNTEAEVAADPNGCTWVPWDAGAVTQATSRSLSGPVTAVRISAVTQQATLQVCGQRDGPG